jgi:hypothetical protein
MAGLENHAAALKRGGQAGLVALGYHPVVMGLRPTKSDENPGDL